MHLLVFGPLFLLRFFADGAFSHCGFGVMCMVGGCAGCGCGRSVGSARCGVGGTGEWVGGVGSNDGGGRM